MDGYRRMINNVCGIFRTSQCDKPSTRRRRRWVLHMGSTLSFYDWQ